MLEFRFLPADLAPGDGKSAGLDTSALRLQCVSSREDPAFAPAYAALWAQFGAAQELESEEVLGRRLAWPAEPGADGLALRYDLLAVWHGEELVAVRDHTAAADASSVVVHLSHVWLTPAWRRTGLAGWLRALPLQTARACLAAAGGAEGAPITLMAEMEYPDGVDASREVRLQAYERAGYQKVAPQVVQYQQPDFRAPREIDATGGPRPLPFQLIVRRVGREGEATLPAGEVREMITRLYAIYGREFRAQDMAVVQRRLALLPPEETLIPLLPPTTPVA